MNITRLKSNVNTHFLVFLFHMTNVSKLFKRMGNRMYKTLLYNIGFSIEHVVQEMLVVKITFKKNKNILKFDLNETEKY